MTFRFPPGRGAPRTTAIAAAPAALVALLGILTVGTGETGDTPRGMSAPDPRACVVLPDDGAPVRLRLHTDASPDAAHLFNTVEIVADGQSFLPSPSGESVKAWLSGPKPDPRLHALTLDGEGPALNATNGMTVVGTWSGAGWKFVELDAHRAYADRAVELERGVLFVEPDLFVVHDHLVARRPVELGVLMRAPSNARIDPVWGDVRLETNGAALLVHAPSFQKQARRWERVETSGAGSAADTATFQLRPANKVARLDLLTVYAVSPRGARREYAFRLLEGSGAIGARIHRDGLPTLVAFKTDKTVDHPTVTGFGFDGPVGVDVFRPKRR